MRIAQIQKFTRRTGWEYMRGREEGVIRKRHGTLEGVRGSSEKLEDTTIQLSAGQFCLLGMSEEPGAREINRTLYHSDSLSK